jgi:hypothetical protein
MFLKRATSDRKGRVPRAVVDGPRAFPVPSAADYCRLRPAVLLVAGPSGAGKSTFIDLLTRGQLPPEIEAELPHGAGRWPHLEANDLLKRGIRADSALLERLHGGEGIVLHYDIAFIYRHGIEEYERDPAAALFAGDNCTIVCLKPARDRLMCQFTSRRERHLQNKSRARQVWARRVRLPLRRAVARLRGQSFPEAIALYKDHDWLGRCYQRWEAFMHANMHGRPSTKVLYVEPCGDVAGPSFRLI